MADEKGTHAESSSAQWNLIESDPGIFTEMLQRLGVARLKVQEIYSLLPEELFIERRDIFGFVFLFKWDAAIRSAGVPLDSIEALREVAVRQPIYFAKQVVKDACATQAIVNALLNIDAMVDVGDELRAFKAATESLPSDVRGIAVEQSALLQRVHNSFSPPHFVEVPPETRKEAHEAFHFVAFVPYADGRVVVELDGLAEEPLVHVSTPEDAPNSGDWIEGALACIRRRVERYAGCLQFTLLAFVRDHRDAWQQEIDALDAIQEPAAEVTERISLLRQQLAEENALMHEFYVENEMRRANFIPLILEMLQVAAENGKLQNFC